MNAIEKTVYRMLKENTGIHMLDSGGAYGRSWQHNATKTLQDFRNDPQVEFKGGYYSISVFHYLCNSTLTFDKTCQEFNKLNHHAPDWDGEYYGVSKRAQAFLNSLGAKEIETFNTYNYESFLSQVLQGTWIKINGDDYLLLQIHGGCDVRGGYTDAVMFYPLRGDRTEAKLIEDVYGTVTKKDGSQIEVSNCYDGVTLRPDDTDAQGDGFKIEDDDKVELELMAS